MMVTHQGIVQGCISKKRKERIQLKNADTNFEKIVIFNSKIFLRKNFQTASYEKTQNYYCQKLISSNSQSYYL